GAADVDSVEGAGEGVETGSVDDDVEFETAIGRFQPGRRDAHDRGLGGVDQLDVVAIVGLEVTSLERHALYTESVILGDEFLGEFGVVDTLANAFGDVVGELGIGLLVGKYLDEVLQPDAEARAVVEPIPQLTPLGGRDLVEAAAVRLVFEAARRARAALEDF